MSDYQPLLTIPQTMNATQLSKATVFRLLQRGELEAVRIGGSTRITRASIDALIERHKAEVGGAA